MKNRGAQLDQGPWQNTFFKREHSLPILTAGLMLGLMETAFAISLAALVFSGPLEAYRSIGIGLALLGAILSSLVIVLFTSLPGIVSGLQELPAVIIALVAADIVLLMPPDASENALIITVLAAIALSTLATALVFGVIGFFGLGNLVRFLPYPVVGGFLAATGWLVVTGGLSVMVALPTDLSQLADLFRPDLILRWLPGVLLAIIMFIGVRRRGNVMVIPIALVAGTLLFFPVAAALGVSLEQLQQGGWVLGPFPEGSLWRPFPLQDLPLVQWGIIAQESAHLAIAILVSVIALLLNAGGIELASRHDLRLNRELLVAGMGNFLSALVSGMVGFQKLGLSTINFRLKANYRLTGLIGISIFVVALVFGASILSLVPQMIVGSLLIYLGLDFLTDWVIDTHNKMPRIEYIILLSILVVTVFVGFLEAIGLGLFAAILLFVIGYSRIEVVRHELTGATYRSRMVRSRREMNWLREQGPRIFILELQGYIFFGTANQLLERVRRRLENADQVVPVAVILDFHRVSGVDSTAILSFSRMQQLASERGTAVVFATRSEEILRKLQYGTGPDQEGPHYFSNLDRAVQWCEDRLLATFEAADDSQPETIGVQMEKILGSEEMLSDVLVYFERQEVGAGKVLIQMGEKACDLYFIESGKVTAQIPREEGPSVRLGSFGAGHVIGEIGLYLGQKRAAEVVVDEPGVVYRLSDQAFQRLEEHDAQAAATLHRLMVLLLAERLTHLTQSFEVLAK